LLALAYGVPALGRIASAAGLPVGPPAPPGELLTRTDPPPAISIDRDEYEAAIAQLTRVVTVPVDRRELSWTRFAWLRSGYDNDLRGLAGLTLAAPALWTTDRPAKVGRPRMLSARSVTVSWTPLVRMAVPDPTLAMGTSPRQARPQGPPA
jgi:hypothetical protein